VVGKLLERGVRTARRSQQREAVAIGHQAAAWWPKCKVPTTGKRHAKCTPVETAIEQTKVARININERSLALEDGQVER
jgi:hypothetical protein